MGSNPILAFFEIAQLVEYRLRASAHCFMETAPSLLKGRPAQLRLRSVEYYPLFKQD